MLNLRDQYLAEVRRELARDLSPVDLAMRLAEIDCHLADGIEARIELGMSPEMAEQEAIEALGLAKQVGRSLAARPPMKRLRWVGAAYLVAAVYLTFGWRLFETYPGLIMALFWAMVSLAIGFAVASFRAARPAVFRVFGFAMAGTGVLWVVTGLSWLSLRPFGGMGVVPRAAVGQYLAESQQELAEKTTDQAALDAGMQALRSPLGIEALRTADGYRAPVVQPVTWRYRDRLNFTTVVSAKEAQAAWINVNRRFDGRRRIGDINSTLAAISQAQADPIHNLINGAAEIVPQATAVAAIAALIDLTFGGLGMAALAMRRRSPRGGVRA